MTKFDTVYKMASDSLNESHLGESAWGNLAAGALATGLLFGTTPKTMAATAPNQPTMATVASQTNMAAPEKRPKSFEDFRDNYMMPVYYAKVDGLPMLSSEAETFAGPRYDMILGKFITFHETGGRYVPKGKKGSYIVRDGTNYVQRLPDPKVGYNIGDGITLNDGVTKFPRLVAKYLRRGVAYDKNWNPLMTTKGIARKIEYLDASVAAAVASDYRAENRAELKKVLLKRGVDYDDLDAFAKLAVEDLAFTCGQNIPYRKMMEALAKSPPDYVRAAYEICNSSDYESFVGLRKRRINDAHLMLMAAKRNGGLDIYMGKLGIESPQQSGGYEEESEKTGMLKHTIAAGDTLWGIARKFHSTVDEICTDNNMRPTDVLRVGHTIYIRPVKGQNMDAAQKKALKPAAPVKLSSTAQYHTVVSGETFSGIAYKNGLRLNQLKSLNPGINYDRIKPGQKVRIK